MSELPPLIVAFLLFPRVTQLDLTGPAQVLSKLGNTTVHLVAKSREPVQKDSGFAILPTGTFEDVQAANILCVPGGFGDQDPMEDDATLEWLRSVGEHADWVTSVCTGALVLGAAGLLRGYRATTHWASHSYLASFGAIPVKERVVFDRNRATGGGVRAGIDFALALTAAIRGVEYAKFVQLSLEYDPTPPFDSGSPETADADLLDRYQRLVAKMAPDRAARREASAQLFRRRVT